METIIKAVLVHKLNDVEFFNIVLTETKHKFIRGRLEYERVKILAILFDLQDNGIIKTVKIPKNKKIQKELDELVKAKRTIDKSIQVIKEIYYK